MFVCSADAHGHLLFSRPLPLHTVKVYFIFVPHRTTSRLVYFPVFLVYLISMKLYMVDGHGSAEDKVR